VTGQICQFVNGLLYIPIRCVLGETRIGNRLCSVYCPKIVKNALATPNVISECVWHYNSRVLCVLRSRVSIRPQHAKCRYKILPVLTVLFSSYSQAIWYPSYLSSLETPRVSNFSFDNCQHCQHFTIFEISTWFGRRWYQFWNFFSNPCTSAKSTFIGIYWHIWLHLSIFWPFPYLFTTIAKVAINR